MPNKRALIVDDSKTAQFKLRKTLSDFDLSIDSVFSAEDALSYLAYQAPDIIFMDHSMKGMSGLDAVKIIKLNPVTAIIPVVMYTAEKGDVYVSQARAVGAMEVLSKDLMTESDIGKVMRSVNILPMSKAQKEKNEQGETQSNKLEQDVAIQSTEVSASLIDVRNQVSRAIDLQHSKIQRDIQDNSRMITRRLMHEVSELHSTLKQQNKNNPVTIFSDLVESIEPPKQRSVLWYLFPMFFLLGLVGYGIYQVDNLKKENQVLIETNQQFVNEIVEQNERIMLSVQRLESQNIQDFNEHDNAIFDNMVWAINQNSGYQYHEFPLDSARTQVIGELLVQLDQSGFNGIVNLNIHSGNFCIVNNDVGELVLPGNGITLADCEFIEYYTPDPSQVEKTAFEFNTLLNTNPVLLKGDITLVVNTLDEYSSTFPYPEVETSISAEQWNNIALQNNNIFIDLESY